MALGGQGGLGRRLRALRLARGLSQVQLAAVIGRHQTTIGPYERGEYAPSPEIVERLAGALETTPEYLCFGRTPGQPTFRFGGRIGPGGVVREAAPDEFAGGVSVRASALLALQIQDVTMSPVYRRGDFALVMALAARDPADLVGRDAVVELADRRQLLRRLLPGAEPDRFELAAYAAPPIANVKVITARAVVGVISAEALAPAAGATL